MATAWTFVGAGNMASSLIGGLIKNGASASDISVVDISTDALKRLNDSAGVNTYTSLADAPAADGLIIAVKPDIVQTVCSSINDSINDTYTNSGPLVISIAAGVREDSMRSWLPDATPIVRCMPNTPALLGLGATALFANQACRESHRALATQLLQSAGVCLWVDTESKLDAVTALSGSGPAYFFNLIEHMISAGIKLGLDEQTATTLAIETAYGAASMARQGDTPPAQLRANVTSKGGTTAAALASFDQHNFADIVCEAMTAANDRAIELGDEFGATP